MPWALVSSTQLLKCKPSLELRYIWLQTLSSFYLLLHRRFQNKSGHISEVSITLSKINLFVLPETETLSKLEEDYNLKYELNAQSNKYSVFNKYLLKLIK